MDIVDVVVLVRLVKNAEFDCIDLLKSLLKILLMILNLVVEFLPVENPQFVLGRLVDHIVGELEVSVAKLVGFVILGDYQVKSAQVIESNKSHSFLVLNPS